MQETLEKIVRTTPGAQAVVLMGLDGIAVEQFILPDSEADGLPDIESMAMEFSFRFIELRNAAASLEMGEISDLTIRAAKGALLVRFLSEEYFVAVLLTDPRYFGKGRWVLRSLGSSLAADLN